MNDVRLLLASDHAGFVLKRFLAEHIGSLKITHGVISRVEDLGCNSAENRVDYPMFAQKLCRELLRAQKMRTVGVLVCGSGLGMSIAANRFRNIRAANCYSSELSVLARRHNNANVICLGGRFIPKEDALSFLELFLNTDFEGDRHQNRNAQLDLPSFSSPE